MTFDDELDRVLGEEDAAGPVARTEAQTARPDAEPDTSAPPMFTLRDLGFLPEMSEKPKVVVPRMALEGRVTLFAAQEKSGKSTLTGEAAAHLSCGSTFLGKPMVQGKVVWLAYDEPMEDAYQRLMGLKADVDKVYLTDYRYTWSQLQDILREVRPDLLVIDTLTEYAVAEGIEDLNSARQWTPILQRIRQECRETRTAAILLHHFTKSQRGYADSRAIAAGVDIILEMYTSHDDERVRYIKFRGRNVGHGRFQMRWVNGRYQLEKAEW